MFTTKRDELGHKYHTNATENNWKDLALEIRKRLDSGEYWVFVASGFLDVLSYSQFEIGWGFGGQTDKAVFNTELGVFMVATLKKGEFISGEKLREAFDLPQDSKVDVFFTAQPNTQKFVDWILYKGGKVTIYPYQDESSFDLAEQLFGKQQVYQNHEMN